MKKTNFFSRMQWLLAVILLMPLVLGAGASVVRASEVEGTAAKYFNAGLDKIEDWVKQSKLPDLKWKTYKELGLLIKPYFKFKYDLSSNVFNAPDDNSTHHDSVWQYTPGFQAMYKSKYGVIGAAYEATFRYFSKFSDQNASDQDFLVFANLFPTDNIYVRTSEKITRKGSTAGNTGFDTIDFTDNTVNITTGYVMGDWTHEVGYQNYTHAFDSTIAQRYSYSENIYDYRLYRKLNRDIRVYQGVRLGDVNFGKDKTRDTFYYEFPLGIEGKLLWGVTVNASIGIHHRNLQNASRNDITHFITNLSAQKSFNKDRTSVDLGFLRRDVESSFSTTTTYDEKMLYTGMKHLITPKLRGRMNLYYGNRNWEERVFTGSRVVVGGRVFVTPPNIVKRDDDVFGFNMGFDVNVRKWLILNIDYQVNRRDSNISALDYTENVFSLGSTIPL